MSKHLGRRLLALAAFGSVLVLLVRRLFPVRVHGSSMEPTLQPGDLNAVSRCRPRQGLVVVVRGSPDVIKRVARVDGERLFLLGDNLESSTDSRTRGTVAAEDVAGVARAVYWPPRRWRLL